MDNIKESLEAMVKNLLYSSESDVPVTVLDWGNVNDAAAKQQLLTDHGKPDEPVKVDANDFFNRYIHRQEMTGDDAMITNAAQFKQLYAYIKSIAIDIQIWRCGSIRIDIYILIRTKENDVLALKTTAVET